MMEQQYTTTNHKQHKVRKIGRARTHMPPLVDRCQCKWIEKWRLNLPTIVVPLYSRVRSLGASRCLNLIWNAKEVLIIVDQDYDRACGKVCVGAILR